MAIRALSCLAAAALLLLPLRGEEAGSAGASSSWERLAPRRAGGFSAGLELGATILTFAEGLFLDGACEGELGIGGRLFLEAAWSWGLLFEAEGLEAFPGKASLGASVLVAVSPNLRLGVAAEPPGESGEWPFRLSLGLLVPRDPALLGLTARLSALIGPGWAAGPAEESRFPYRLTLEASCHEAVNDALGLGALAWLSLDFAGGALAGSSAGFGASIALSGSGWHCSVAGARDGSASAPTPRLALGRRWGMD